MRVIFLDVDGVLNSEGYLRKIDAKHHALGHEEPARPKHETTCDCYKLHHQIDRDAIARLNRLVAATAAKIVISSSWRRLFDLPDLERILVDHGLVAEIIGVTPEGHEEPEMAVIFGPLERIFRGHEIDFWLRKHPEVDRFVILDDGGDMEMHQSRLVQTDCEEGLLDDHIKLAIRVMAWDGNLAGRVDQLETIHVDDLSSALPPSRNRKNNYRWDAIGGYVVSTIRLPADFAEVTGPQYETLVLAPGGWDTDGSGVRTMTKAEADAAHDTACARIRGQRQ